MHFWTHRYDLIVVFFSFSFCWTFSCFSVTCSQLLIGPMAGLQRWFTWSLTLFSSKRSCCPKKGTKLCWPSPSCTFTGRSAVWVFIQGKVITGWEFSGLGFAETAILFEIYCFNFLVFSFLHSSPKCMTLPWLISALAQCSILIVITKYSLQITSYVSGSYEASYCVLVGTSYF